MKVKSESDVTQSYPTLGDPMDRSPPGSSVHGIFQARVLEWGAIAFSVKYIAELVRKSGKSLEDQTEQDPWLWRCDMDLLGKALTERMHPFKLKF